MQHIGGGQGALVLSEEGATIRLFQSKTVTSQSGRRTCSSKPGLALAAVKRWVSGVGIAQGTPMFRAITKGGRVSRAAADRWQHRADREIALREAGLDPVSSPVTRCAPAWSRQRPRLACPSGASDFTPGTGPTS